MVSSLVKAACYMLRYFIYSSQLSMHVLVANCRRSGCILAIASWTTLLHQ